MEGEEGETGHNISQNESPQKGRADRKAKHLSKSGERKNKHQTPRSDGSPRSDNYSEDKDHSEDEEPYSDALYQRAIEDAKIENAKTKASPFKMKKTQLSQKKG